MESRWFSWMAALGDPTRARMLHLLEQHELSVNELAHVLQLPQSTTSRHLRVLTDDGWVGSRRDGTSRLYRLTEDPSNPERRLLWTVTRDALRAEKLFAQDCVRLERLLLERRSHSEEFFAKTAAYWDGLRDELFGTTFQLSMLASLLSPSHTVGDLGCGTGRLTQIIAPHCRRVFAVDSSEAMVELARQRLQPSTNVEVIHAPLQNLPLKPRCCDVVLLSLVLHYIMDPPSVLRGIARVTAPRGKLVIADVQPHNRHEYRSEMGHVWFGFGESQLADWLHQAGFNDMRYVALPAEAAAKGPPMFICVSERSNSTDRSRRAGAASRHAETADHVCIQK